jgi:hypothetical protein
LKPVFAGQNLYPGHNLLQKENAQFIQEYAGKWAFDLDNVFCPKSASIPQYLRNVRFGNLRNTLRLRYTPKQISGSRGIIQVLVHDTKTQQRQPHAVLFLADIEPLEGWR